MESRRCSGLAATLALLAFACGGAHAQATPAEPTATVIEYRNASLGHYFVTADPAEAAMLDAGVVVPGWQRTGVEFHAWAGGADRPGTAPVCRFFGVPGRGPNSHFYTADAGECALVKTHPDWRFETIAFWIDVPQAGACAAGTTPVYRSFHAGSTVSDGNHRLLIDYTMHARMAADSVLEGVVMCSPLSTAQREADAARLLEQASWGPTEATLAHVVAVGAERYVDEQLALPSTRYTAFAPVPANRPDTCVDDRTLPLRADSYCARDNYTLFQLQREFFRNAVAAPDQLRQRVAFALSQILVVSGTEINTAYAMQRYQQLLADLAFDNYERVLTEVTLSPAMGRYLDMVNNVKPNPATGTAPNENYARELLQLFAVGTVELAADGKPLSDGQGRPIAAYDQDTIEGFAHVFTGWTYPTAPGQLPRPLNGAYYDGRMEERVAAHDFNAKALLDGTAAANLPMGADLYGALHDVFLHPNVGPFVTKQLIQKLVTGEPSAGYVARIAAVFADNGNGVRGDLRAVVRALLLDPEARGPAKLDPGYGKLREPAKLVIGAARALDTATDGVYLRSQTGAMGQPVFVAPSVFNFYPPDYVVPGTTRIGPEFALQNTASTFARINYVNALAFGTLNPDPTVYGATGTQPDWSPLTAVAGDANALVAKLDRLLTQRTLSAAAKRNIVAAVSALPATDLIGRARTAFYLVATSSHYQVER